MHQRNNTFQTYMQSPYNEEVLKSADIQSLVCVNFNIYSKVMKETHLNLVELYPLYTDNSLLQYLENLITPMESRWTMYKPWIVRSVFAVDIFTWIACNHAKLCKFNLDVLYSKL